MLIDHTYNLSVEQQMKNPIDILRCLELVNELSGALSTLRTDGELPTNFREQAYDLREKLYDFEEKIEELGISYADIEDDYTFDPTMSDFVEDRTCKLFHVPDDLETSEELDTEDTLVQNDK